MVELVRAGRAPESLSREFEPSAQSISNGVRQADLYEGNHSNGLATDEDSRFFFTRRTLQ